MNTPIYYKGEAVTQEFVYDIAENHSIGHDIVSEVIEQIRKNGEPTYASYVGMMRQKVEELADNLSFGPEENAPAPVEESQNLADKAASSLIQAFAPEDCDHFLINEKGFLSVNENNPPTIEQGLVLADQILQTETLGDKIKDKTAWMLGSLVVEMETLFGEDFNISQVCEQTNKAENTVSTARSVYQAFKDKPFNLSFTHHKEAHYKKVPHQVKTSVLRKAELYGLSAHDVRDLLSIYQKIEDDQVIKNIRSAEGAKDLIDAYKEIKTTFYIFEGGELHQHRGLTTEPPSGSIVINTKAKTYTIEGGEPLEIKSWKKQTENT